ncbi:RseA family anti-sigma factor [Lysobacter brunescens]|uniref:RseA family anti-sigma factor n=1 Tax=Lysobacter brunescens TaxID=262323 RepID=A0ABW2YCZ6_9GAMM
MTGMHDIDTKHDAQGREFHRERLSAMMDDALSADESRFLLRRMEHDDELADCWQRWQFYGDAMRGGAGRALPADFAQRVGRAIANDIAEAEVAPIRVARGGRSFLYWGGGAALAASVALAALFGTRLDTPAAGDLQIAGATSPAAATLPVPAPAPQLPSVPEPTPGLTPGTVGAVAAATVVAAAAVSEQRRDTKPRLMAASRAMSERTSERAALASAAPSSVQNPSRARQGAASSAAVDASVQTYAAVDASRAAAPGMSPAQGSKSWPRALVPGASQSDEVMVTYPIETTRRSPFQPDFVPLIDASQAEQAGRGH